MDLDDIFQYIGSTSTSIQNSWTEHRTQIHDVVLGVTIFASLAWVVYISLQSLLARFRGKAETARPATPDIEKDKGRKRVTRNYGGMYMI